jgi:galactokinase
MKREQCEEGIVKNNFPEITSFRDCTEQHILGLQNVMSAFLKNLL